jgi:hypothetical protein
LASPRLGLACAFPCVVLLLAAQAHGDVREGTDAMLRLMRDLRYEEAVARGLHALREAGPKEQARLAPIYRMLGTAYFLLGDESHARGAWVQLFALDPDARPPEDASPKLRQYFDRIRLEAAAVALDPAPLKEIPEGRPFLFEARLAGSAPRVDKVYIHFRTEGAGAYSAKRLEQRGGRLVATVPGVVLADAGPRAFEYWIEARDAQGVPVAAAGTDAAPLRARIIPRRPAAVAEPAGPGTPAPPPPAPEPPFYSKWWFWGIVAGAAAGTATAIYLGTRGGATSGLDVCVGFQDSPCPTR